MPSVIWKADVKNVLTFSASLFIIKVPCCWRRCCHPSRLVCEALGDESWVWMSWKKQRQITRVLSHYSHALSARMLGIQPGFELTALSWRHTLYEPWHTDSPHYTITVTSVMSSVALPASNTATRSLRRGDVHFSLAAWKQWKWTPKQLHPGYSSTGTWTKNPRNPESQGKKKQHWFWIPDFFSLLSAMFWFKDSSFNYLDLEMLF